MPIYDYACRGCGHRFEGFVRKESDLPKCPSCEGSDLERLLSTPRLHTSGRKERSMKAARARDKKGGFEREMAQREYELSHDD